MSETGARPGWDDYFLGVAAAVAARADCTRRKVGAVLVGPDHRVMATGYNGTAAAGAPGCLTAGACPRGRRSYAEVPADAPYDDCIAVHAEMNALAGVDPTRLAGATLYVTSAPCHRCRPRLAGLRVVHS